MTDNLITLLVGFFIPTCVITIPTAWWALYEQPVWCRIIAGLLMAVCIVLSFIVFGGVTPV
jgi:hypothetical protein